MVIQNWVFEKIRREESVVGGVEGEKNLHIGAWGSGTHSKILMELVTFKCDSKVDVVFFIQIRATYTDK